MLLTNVHYQGIMQILIFVEMSTRISPEMPSKHTLLWVILQPILKKSCKNQKIPDFSMQALTSGQKNTKTYLFYVLKNSQMFAFNWKSI